MGTYMAAQPSVDLFRAHGHLALVYNGLLGLTLYPSEWFDVVLLDEAGWFM
jgi:hypothetical protein